MRSHLNRTVRDTPSPTRSAGVAVSARSTGNTRPVPSAVTLQRSCARMSGARRLSAERPPVPAACAPSGTCRGNSRTASEKTPSQRSVPGQPRRHERRKRAYYDAPIYCFTYFRIFSYAARIIFYARTEYMIHAMPPR